MKPTLLPSKLEKALEEYKDKIPADLAASIQRKIDAAHEAVKGGQIDRIRAARDDLDQEIQKIGETMKGATSSSPPGAEMHTQSPPPPKGEETIEEAEVEVIDDEDKK